MKLCYLILALVTLVPNVTLKKSIQGRAHLDPSHSHPALRHHRPDSHLSPDTDFDKASARRRALLPTETKPLSPVLRQSILLTLEKDSASHFVSACLRKGLCSKDQVLHGMAGKPWKFRVRHRRGVMKFWQIYECYAYNRPLSCPVDGRWSSWGARGKCSATCGRGVRSRKRVCNNPSPANYGKFCVGSAMEREPCVQTCAKDFKALAGQSPLKQQALSVMTSIEKQYNSSLNAVCSKDHCTFNEVHELIPDEDAANQYWLSMHCVEKYIGCPVNGGWSDWHPWSNCTSHCGIGERFRIRGCNDPPPANGGAPCEGDAYEREDCVGTHCPSAGNSSVVQDSIWTEWSDWSRCTAKDCMTYGTQISKRLCIGNTKPPLCDIGNGTLSSVLQRRKPCVMKGCRKDVEELLRQNYRELVKRLNTTAKPRVSKPATKSNATTVLTKKPTPKHVPKPVVTAAKKHTSITTSAVPTKTPVPVVVTTTLRPVVTSQKIPLSSKRRRMKMRRHRGHFLE